MKVLVFPVNKNPEVREIDGSLESWQEIVGGWVECTKPIIHLFIGDYDLGDNYSLMCNEDGMMKNLPVNRGYLGNFFITKVVYPAAGGDEEFVSIPDKTLETMIKLFSIS
jgi:hypothetical protein